MGAGDAASLHSSASSAEAATGTSAMHPIPGNEVDSICSDVSEDEVEKHDTSDGTRSHGLVDTALGEAGGGSSLCHSSASVEGAIPKIAELSHRSAHGDSYSDFSSTSDGNDV